MRALLRVTVLLTLAAAAVVIPAGVAGANVSMGISLSWPSGAGVGNGNLAGSFTVQNLNTAPNQTETLTVTVIRLAPSCGAAPSGTTVCPSPDPGVFHLSSPATGAAGTACAGVTFTVSAPDASGAVTLTPSTAVVLQGPGAGTGPDRCTVNMVLAVTKVPSIDVDPAVGVQTSTNLFVQATSSTSGLMPAVGVKLTNTVNKGIPGLSTAASAAGTTVSDTATLTAAGSGPTPTGTVTFNLFGPNDSTCSGASMTSTKSVSNGSATAAFSSTGAGTYRFTVSYSGDTNYMARLAQCNDPGESVTVSSSVSPPTITKSFQKGSIPLGATTTLAFTIGNPAANTVALTGVQFTDSLPAGLLVATPNALSGSCGGGTITAVAGSGAVSLSGATLATNGSCTFSVNVTGTTAGQKKNTVAVTSANGGTSATSKATLKVLAPPQIVKAFGAGTIALGATTTLTFTITNPAANPGALKGVAFTDPLPAGLVVANPNGLVGSCGSGTITAVAGSGTVRLAGATLSAGATCTFSVKVSATTTGQKNNAVTVTSNNGGTGNTSNASLTVS
ncbi:MAG: trimeric autotransporter adhesin [Acidimicrobiaceae bacterium]|nr:trimeric autotransporter adhesin [Acidimicrobiaceae bacterium]